MFNCVTCEKVYLHKRNLVRHVKIHDGDASMNRCGICHKTFTRRDNLGNHVQNCHKIAKKTPEFQNAVRITDAMVVRDSVIHWALPATTPPHVDSVALSPAPISNSRTDASTPLQASSYERVPVITINPAAHTPTQTPPPSSVNRVRRNRTNNNA